MADTTKTYLPDAADDLVDSALAAIEGRKDIESLTRLALIAACALETRGFRVTAKRLRVLSNRVQQTMGIH